MGVSQRRRITHGDQEELRQEQEEQATPECDRREARGNDPPGGQGASAAIARAASLTTLEARGHEHPGATARDLWSLGGDRKSMVISRLELRAFWIGLGLPLRGLVLAFLCRGSRQHA